MFTCCSILLLLPTRAHTHSRLPWSAVVPYLRFGALRHGDWKNNRAAEQCRAAGAARKLRGGTVPQLHQLRAGGGRGSRCGTMYQREEWKKRVQLPNTAVTVRLYCFKNILLLLGLCLFIGFKRAFHSCRICKFLTFMFKDPDSSVLVNVLKYFT